MNNNLIQELAVLNTVLATGKNVKAETGAGIVGGGQVLVASNDISGSAVPQLIINPLHKGEIVAGVKQASQLEVRQISVIGLPDGTTASPVRETIVKDKRYKIEITHSREKTETGQKPVGIYAYTAPSVLSGTASTDRENVFTKLMNKINAHASNYGEAFLLRSSAFTLGQTALPVVGETITQETSTETAKIAAVWVSSGDITTGDAAGLIFYYDISDESAWLTTAKTLTGGTSGFVCTATNATYTTGEGLVFVDDAGYYSPRPATRQGAPYVQCTQGFDVYTAKQGEGNTLTAGATGLLCGRAAVIGRGYGSRLIQDIPVFTPGGENIISGEAAYAKTNASFNAAKTYTQYVLTKRINSGPAQQAHGGATPKDTLIVIYADEDNATYLAAFESALETALGITIA